MAPPAPVWHANDDRVIGDDDGENPADASAAAADDEVGLAAGSKGQPTRRTWSAGEDANLKEVVERLGAGQWALIAENMGGSRKDWQCRERWLSHLCPAVKKGGWSTDEDQTLVQAFERYGQQWARIGQLLPGRTGHGIKNRYHSLKRRGFSLHGRGVEQAMAVAIGMPLLGGGGVGTSVAGVPPGTVVGGVAADTVPPALPGLGAPLVSALPAGADQLRVMPGAGTAADGSSITPHSASVPGAANLQAALHGVAGQQAQSDGAVNGLDVPMMGPSEMMAVMEQQQQLLALMSDAWSQQILGLHQQMLPLAAYGPGQQQGAYGLSHAGQEQPRNSALQPQPQPQRHGMGAGAVRAHARTPLDLNSCGIINGAGRTLPSGSPYLQAGGAPAVASPVPTTVPAAPRAGAHADTQHSAYASASGGAHGSLVNPATAAAQRAEQAAWAAPARAAKRGRTEDDRVDQEQDPHAQQLLRSLSPRTHLNLLLGYTLQSMPSLPVTSSAARHAACLQHEPAAAAVVAQAQRDDTDGGGGGARVGEWVGGSSRGSAHRVGGMHPSPTVMQQQLPQQACVHRLFVEPADRPPPPRPRTLSSAQPAPARAAAGAPPQPPPPQDGLLSLAPSSDVRQRIVELSSKLRTLAQMDEQPGRDELLDGVLGELRMAVLAQPRADAH